jgi:hypothetical protein
MRLVIDVSSLPPTMELVEVDELTEMTVEVVSSSDVWIDPAMLVDLAGHRGDPEWSVSFAQMVAYAATRGLVGDDGCVRARVEQVSVSATADPTGG